MGKYKKIQKAILTSASTGVITGLIVMGVATPALAEAAQEGSVAPVSYTEAPKVPSMHMTRRWNSPSRALSLAETLGLDKDAVLAEIKSGKSMKQILQENGVDLGELNQAFQSKKQSKRWR